MKTLRVLLGAAPDSARADAWALFDTAGRRLARGRDVPDAWPAADRIEAVIGARAVRIIALELPRLPPARVATAAEYALEDRLAAPAGELHIAVAPQGADGRVLATVVGRELMRALAAPTPKFERIVAEPALTSAAQGWRWSVSDEGSGFVRRADGSAFPLGSTGADGALPPELKLALAQARRDGTSPQRVVVADAVTDAQLRDWTEESGVTFARGQERAWDDADPTAFATATDLLQGEFSRVRPVTRTTVARLFVPALVFVVCAITLHVLATLGTWGWLNLERWGTERALVALARDAGASSTSSNDAAAASVAKRYADLRHRAGLSAPDDALPLLARAAPALGALPGGTLKVASYTGGAWTLELMRPPEPALAMLEQRLAAAGLVTLQAATPAGVRMRIGERIHGS